MKEEAEEW